MDAQAPAQGAEDLRQEAHARLGLGPLRHRLPEHQVLRAVDEAQAASWNDLPDDIKNTYDKLGIPEAEKQRLVSGVAAQYESEVVYHKIREDLEEQGVLFWTPTRRSASTRSSSGEYFGSVIPAGDNKFAALNTAVWSGGSFIYVPKGVKVEIPLQAYFRINAENMGQFERTLIIVTRAPTCTTSRAAPRRSTRPTPCTRRWWRSSSRSTPAAATRPSRTGRTTSTTWSPSGPSPTRAHHGVGRRQHRLQADDEVPGRVDGRRAREGRGHLGRVRLRGSAPGRRREDGHVAPDTSSTIVSKSVSRGGGRTCYRGLVQVEPGRVGREGLGDVRRAAPRHDSRSDTYPYVDVREDDVSMGHEATVSRVATTSCST